MVRKVHFAITRLAKSLISCGLCVLFWFQRYSGSHVREPWAWLVGSLRCTLDWLRLGQLFLRQPYRRTPDYPGRMFRWSLFDCTLPYSILLYHCPANKSTDFSRYLLQQWFLFALIKCLPSITTIGEINQSSAASVRN